jgi:hypothetical protein
MSCETSKNPDGLAQKLANRLGKIVVAPNNYMFFRQDGSTYLGSRNPSTLRYIPGTSGRYVGFAPQPNGKR